MLWLPVLRLRDEEHVPPLTCPDALSGGRWQLVTHRPERRVLPQSKGKSQKTIVALVTRPSTAGRRTRPSAHVSRCSFGRTVVTLYHCPERRVLPKSKGRYSGTIVALVTRPSTAGRTSTALRSRVPTSSRISCGMLFREDGGNFISLP